MWKVGRTSNPLVENAAALYAVQLAGYVLPLITVPFLARVLRPDGFGLLALAQSLALWLSILLEYGFNLSATRAVAAPRMTPARARPLEGRRPGDHPPRLAASTEYVGSASVQVTSPDGP